MKRYNLFLFFGRRRGIRLGRTNRNISLLVPRVLSIGVLADWEIELLTKRKRGPFFAW